ncbi:hypothetical protein RLW55_09890 [Hyphomicrobium sp. B1]|uniref:hypothetical protein n=1 Tax=Hyphomicrobium sp. B1 TaxID=3075651 RepID=UPI003C2E7A47
MDATLFTAIAGTLLGIGFGLTIPLVNHMTVEHSSYARRGQNLAYLSVAIFLGQFLSSFVDVVVGSAATAFLLASGAAFAAAVAATTSGIAEPA